MIRCDDAGIINCLNLSLLTLFIIIPRGEGVSKFKKTNTGCPKSPCAKVPAYCSACDHLIRKISSGMFQIGKQNFLGKQNFIFRLNNINIYHKYQ